MDLYIHLPTDYDRNQTKKYPVLYILDGQWDFKLMDSVLGGLVYLSGTEGLQRQADGMIMA